MMRPKKPLVFCRQRNSRAHISGNRISLLSVLHQTLVCKLSFVLFVPGELFTNVKEVDTDFCHLNRIAQFVGVDDYDLFPSRHAGSFT